MKNYFETDMNKNKTFLTNACLGRRMAQEIVNGYSKVDVRIWSQSRPHSLPVMYVHIESNRRGNKTQHTLN
jgi:hypothetical protein